MPLFPWLYEDTDRVIEMGTRIPFVNLEGRSPEVNEDQVAELPHEIPPQPPVIEPTVSKPTVQPTVEETPTIEPTTQQDKGSPEAVTSVPTVESQPSKPKNIVINVEDNAKATDR